MIQITDLSFSFGKTRVLENLNLTVPDGCIMGLVGINGAGKSTLFRLLTSIYTAESGSTEMLLPLESFANGGN